jgi:hypothetical protein
MVKKGINPLKSMKIHKKLVCKMVPLVTKKSKNILMKVIEEESIIKSYGYQSFQLLLYLLSSEFCLQNAYLR